MAYPGGKNGAGVYQRIINLMPPHDTYVEPFLGGGAVMRLKRPATLNIGLDLDRALIRAWRAALDRPSPNLASAAATKGRPLPEPSPVPAVQASADLVASPAAAILVASPAAAMCDRGAAPRQLDPASLNLPVTAANFRFVHGDALTWLRNTSRLGSRDLVYCDPPYVHSTRGRADLYKHEMTDAQHSQLLDAILNLQCMVMISGYWCSLYARRLKNWNAIHFEAMTRAGRTATEWLWFNFPVPVALHDYSYLGENFRERERIKRKKLRWSNRLRQMPLLEKRALLAAIEATA